MSTKENFFFILTALRSLITEIFAPSYWLCITPEKSIEEVTRNWIEQDLLNKKFKQDIDKEALTTLLCILECMKLLPRTKLIHLINTIKDKERLYKLLYMVVFEKNNPEELSLLLKENKIEMLIEIFDRLEPASYNRLDLLGPKYSLVPRRDQPSISLEETQRNETQRTSLGVLASKSRIPVHVKDKFKPLGNSNKNSTTLRRKCANPNRIKPFTA